MLNLVSFKTYNILLFVWGWGAHVCPREGLVGILWRWAFPTTMDPREQTHVLGQQKPLLTEPSHQPSNE